MRPACAIAGAGGEVRSGSVQLVHVRSGGIPPRLEAFSERVMVIVKANKESEAVEKLPSR